MKNKIFSIRISEFDLEAIQDKAKYYNISQSELISIAVKLVKSDDVKQYLLNKLDNKPIQDIFYDEKGKL